VVVLNQHKAAQEALKNLKDLQEKFKQAAKNAAGKAPDRVKADVAKSLAELGMRNAQRTTK
jgi:hypothetical protein